MFIKEIIYQKHEANWKTQSLHHQRKPSINFFAQTQNLQQKWRSKHVKHLKSPIQLKKSKKRKSWVHEENVKTWKFPVFSKLEVQCQKYDEKSQNWRKLWSKRKAMRCALQRTQTFFRRKLVYLEIWRWKESCKSSAWRGRLNVKHAGRGSFYLKDYLFHHIWLGILPIFLTIFLGDGNQCSSLI